MSARLKTTEIMENGKEGKFLSSSQELHYVDEDEGGDLFHVKSVSGNVSKVLNG